MTDTATMEHLHAENARLKTENQRLTRDIRLFRDEYNYAWAALPKTEEDYLPDAIKAALKASEESHQETRAELSRVTAERDVLKDENDTYAKESGAILAAMPGWCSDDGLVEGVVSLAASHEGWRKEAKEFKAEYENARNRIKYLCARVTELANRVDQLEAHLSAKPEPVADAECRELLELAKSEAAEKHRLLRELSAIESIIRDELGIVHQGSDEQYREALRKSLDELTMKVTPVEDAEIARVLEEIDCRSRDKSMSTIYCDLRKWHDTLQAVGAEVVVAREILEQCKTALPAHMRDGGVIQGIVALKGALAKACDQRDEMTERCNMAASERTAQLQQLTKERDEARKSAEGDRGIIKAAYAELPQGVRHQRLAEAIKEHRQWYTQAAEHAQGAAAEMRKERDEAIAKANEMDVIIGHAWDALPHDVKVRGGYLAGRIGDLVRDRDEARADLASKNKQTRRLQIAISKIDDLRTALSRMASIPDPVREYGIDDLAILINLVCDEVDRLRTRVTAFEAKDQRCADNGGMCCPLGECHPSDDISPAN